MKLVILFLLLLLNAAVTSYVGYRMAKKRESLWEKLFDLLPAVPAVAAVIVFFWL